MQANIDGLTCGEDTSELSLWPNIYFGDRVTPPPVPSLSHSTSPFQILLLHFLLHSESREHLEKHAKLKKIP
ncbi:hypothetical protein E2C01_011011 [Portunus trituberculatus]|uniref:Uncharacterized protein n=1 Tax=Portunus trituberculatus TaxID=210409 RepID=A0A5B7DAE3_PORTR|nr:hypothetical protein [Portunus trituberculatus]